MRKLALAGILALTIASPAFAQDITTSLRPGMQSGIVLTQSQIAYFRATLKLRPSQAQHWPAIEATLHDIARQQAPKFTAQGAPYPPSRNTVKITLTATAVERLTIAARSLVRSLDDGQKLDAMRMAHEVGLASVVSSLN